MKININDYRQKVLGCWMGKNIGGTLGAPFEWYRQVNNVSYYTHDIDGDPLPNDDLDIQLLWLIALEQKGPKLDSKILGSYFNRYVTHNANEYGICKVNMRAGLQPPVSGTFNNHYKHSCGAYIRSEIWACVAPGCPEQAAKYAFEDAIIDHGDGEGTYGAVFCAALESAAFVEKDINRLIDIGLSYIPENCDLAKAINSVREWHTSGLDWIEAREKLIAEYSGHTHGWNRISEEDKTKGYGEGKLGWDIPSNIGIIVLGMLYGEGDFDKSICTMVNCGEDTDCTAATYGSIYGIINGIDAFDKKWTDPIGRNIKVISLDFANLGGIMHTLIAKDIDELADRTEKVMLRVTSELVLPVKVSESETNISSAIEDVLYANDDFDCVYDRTKGICYDFGEFNIRVEYADGPIIKEGEPMGIKLVVENKFTDEEFSVSPHTDGVFFISGKNKGENVKTLEYELISESITHSSYRFAVQQPEHNACSGNLN